MNVVDNTQLKAVIEAVNTKINSVDTKATNAASAAASAGTAAAAAQTTADNAASAASAAASAASAAQTAANAAQSTANSKQSQLYLHQLALNGELDDDECIGSITIINDISTALTAAQIVTAINSHKVVSFSLFTTLNYKFESCTTITRAEINQANNNNNNLVITGPSLAFDDLSDVDTHLSGTFGIPVSKIVDSVTTL